MHIGEAIRITRLRLGRTQESIALEAGFNPGNLSRLELGRQSVTLERLFRVAAALGVVPSYLLRMIEAPTTSAEVQLQEAEAAYAPEIRALNQAYAVLKADHRATVLRLTQDLAKAQRIGEQR